MNFKKTFGYSSMFFGLFFGVFFGVTSCLVLNGWAAVTDVLPDEATRSPQYIELSPRSERHAKAIAYFIDGLLDEETFGPEKALESFRKVLDLDPGYGDLAIKVASDFLRRGENADALAVLKDALKASPKSVPVCLALSSIYLRQLSKSELAISYANKALDLDPTNFAPYEALWEIYQSLGNHQKAMHVLDRAARVESKDPYYWASLGDFMGRTLLRKDMRLSVDDAQHLTTIFEKSVEFGSSEPDILIRAAYFFILLNQDAKAIPLLEKALTLDPDRKDARIRLAGCYMATEKIDDAIQIFVQISEENPLDPKVHDMLADLYSRKKNWERAASALQQAVLIDPNNPERQRQLAVILLSFLQRPAEAERVLIDAMTRFSAYPEFRLLYASALSQSGKHDQALNAFGKMEAQWAIQLPDYLNADFYFNYAIAAEQAGRLDRAEALFKKAIDADPLHAGRIYNYMGYMWAERGIRLQEAEEMIRKALEEEPNNGAYIDSLGWVYYQSGKTKDALRELLRAAALLEEPDAVVFEHIGDAQFKLGDHAQALIFWRKAIDLDPDNKQILAKIDTVTAHMAAKKQP